MKKLLLLALGAATLSLGSCSRHTCPAYSSSKQLQRAPVSASTSSTKHTGFTHL